MAEDVFRWFITRLLKTLLLMLIIPEGTKLFPNYPNPFNPETWIPYQLSEASSVTMTIYDTLGTRYGIANWLAGQGRSLSHSLSVRLIPQRRQAA
jgi:hypothetical protein